MRRNSFEMVLFALCAAMISMLISAKSVVAADMPCTQYANPVRIKIGDLALDLPADLLPEFPDKSHKAVFNVKGTTLTSGQVITSGYCQKESDARLVVHGVSFWALLNQSPSHILSMYRYLTKANISLTASEAMRPYCNEISEANGRDWSVYTANPAFKEAIGPNGVFRYYTSSSVTLLGLPVLIECTQEKKESTTAQLGRFCHLKTPIDTSVEVELQFNDITAAQPRNWGKLMKELEDFLKSIAPQKLPNLDLKQCQ